MTKGSLPVYTPHILDLLNKLLSEAEQHMESQMDEWTTKDDKSHNS